MQTAYHGLTKISQEDVVKAYPEPIEFVGMHTIRYWACSSQFEIPYIFIAQQLIEKIDSGELKLEHHNHVALHPNASDESVPSSAGTVHPPEVSKVAYSPYYDLSDDIHATINYNFGNFEDGYYFEPFRNGTISDLIFDRKNLVPWLRNLRQSGVKLMLLTNSNHHYTKVMMNFAFGEDWKPLFDLVVYRTKKPTFFLQEAPFYKLVDPLAKGETIGLQIVPKDEKIVEGVEYYGGNEKKLRADILGPSATVVYVGDELFGDVLAPTVYSGWKSIAIVEELQEAEAQAGFQISDLPNPEILEATDSNLAIERWGNYFYTSDNHKLTFYGAIMHHFAEIAIPDVSRLVSFSVDSAFLPLHPAAQVNATVPANQKLVASVHLTENAAQDLPHNWEIPDLDRVSQLGTFAKLLKDIREQLVNNVN